MRLHDHSRSFYQTIAFTTTRTGKIVKTEMETSSAAASIMKELESACLQMIIKILCCIGMVQCCDDAQCHVITMANFKL